MNPLLLESLGGGLLVGLSLGALGGGGSILAIPTLIYLLGQNAHDASTIALVVVAASAAMGLVVHARSGTVDAKAGLLFGVVGIAANLGASQLSGTIDPRVLALGFAAITLVAAWRMWSTMCSSEAKSDTAQRSLDATSLTRVVLVGSAVGALTGLFGVGGGFAIVPALVLALGFSMPSAVGTSLLIIVINSVVALIGRGGIANVNSSILIPFVAGAVIGSVLGKSLGSRLPDRTTAQAFAVLLVLIALYMGVDNTIKLTQT